MVGLLRQVVNDNANTLEMADYTLTATVFEANATLVQSERDALRSLFESCCADTMDACRVWKNSSSSDGVYTNFCSYPDQICTPEGNDWQYLHLLLHCTRHPFLDSGQWSRNLEAMKFPAKWIYGPTLCCAVPQQVGLLPPH